MTRLTFVGDISLDKPLLKAAKARGNGKYDFSDVFHTEDVFQRSDLVVGNLETVFGGGRRFNKKPYHYNSPDSFCKAVKDAGINLVSTANNHCMDEGVAGLRRTLEQLDACGIEHTGTFPAATEDRFLVKEINGVRIAFYSLTYSVNICKESIEAGDLYRYINLTGFSAGRVSKIQLLKRYVIGPKIKQISLKKRGQSTISSHPDIFKTEQIKPEWMADIERQIRLAREQSDVLVVLLHSGGQFNIEPGDYSRFMMDKLCALGADIIIGNHSHTTQRIENRSGKIVAYSLGGYCMSASGEYLVHECLPEFNLAVHVDIDETGRIEGFAAEVLKNTEDGQASLNVRMAKDDDEGADAIRIRCGL